MALPSIFSRRKHQASKTAPDVYIYNDISRKLRVQILHLIISSFGYYDPYSRSAELWNSLITILREEIGVFSLVSYPDDPQNEFVEWFQTVQEIDTVLDAIEIAFRIIEHDGESRFTTPIVNKLNARLQEDAVGYQFIGGEIIRVDSQHLHSEVILPALKLLGDPKFAGADDEYRDAHQFYRNRDYESCLTECAKSLESVLKVIGAERRWKITNNDTAKKLLDAAYSANFIPTYMQTQFTALRSVLESGAPTIRNKSSAHGAGGTVRKVDAHLAAYQLHLSAAAIVFLANEHKSKP